MLHTSVATSMDSLSQDVGFIVVSPLGLTLMGDLLVASTPPPLVGWGTRKCTRGWGCLFENSCHQNLHTDTNMKCSLRYLQLHGSSTMHALVTHLLFLFNFYLIFYYYLVNYIYLLLIYGFAASTKSWLAWLYVYIFLWYIKENIII
jgi:hypothetical protein